MIGLIGIKKDTPLEIREKLIVFQKKNDEYNKKLLEVMTEVIILSTCNRTEIYFNTFLDIEKLLKKVFEIFNWDYKYKSYVFIVEDKKAFRHLFEVTAGFHSKILGEDQILGQVKNAYEEAIKNNLVKYELHRLFQEVITSGKRFRKEARLFEIPVSSASIAVSEGINRGCKRFMILGYGEVGKLVLKYLVANNLDVIYLVVRNKKIKDEITDERVRVTTFDEKNQYIDEVQCIISCTAAPHIVIRKKDINEEGHKLLIYDLAVPRDVEKSVEDLSRAEIYNIDSISLINDKNKILRKERMEENRNVLSKYLDEYINWLKIRSIAPKILELKTLGNEVYTKRSETLYNKSKHEEDISLANRLIKSASDFYINRAIDVMKEETLKGSGEECIRIIEKIFLNHK